MASVLVLGATSPARLTQILDAAVSRLGLTEVRVVAGGEMDSMVTEWNSRRYELRRYWDAQPVADIALIFPGWDGSFDAGRVIYVDGD